jgi:hypothetical protein
LPVEPEDEFIEIDNVSESPEDAAKSLKSNDQETPIAASKSNDQETPIAASKSNEETPVVVVTSQKTRVT